MRSLSVATSVMLVFSCPVRTAGPGFTGSLRSSGVVLANSELLPDGGAVRTGDRITTDAGGLATIQSPVWGRLEVRAGSQARLGDDRVHLERGAVAAVRLAVETGGYTIQPQDSKRSWFAVANRDGRLIVAAHRGSVLIASAGTPLLVVPEGSFAQEDEEQKKAPAPERRKEKKRKRRSAGATAAAGAGGWTIGGLSHAASVALVVGVGAGVAAVSVGAALALSDDNPSPSD